MPEVVVKTIGEDSIAYCAEKWGQYEKGRLVVSLFSMLVQVNKTIGLVLSGDFRFTFSQKIPHV